MDSSYAFSEIKTTADVLIPKDPIEHIIGQDNAVKIAKIAAMQRRNLLLVGPPGTGKSMIAQAIAFHLPKPTQEVSVLHNPESPEKPIVEVRDVKDIEKEKRLMKELSGRLVGPLDVPAFVAEKLGFRCRRCGRLSKSSEDFCPNCGFDKFKKSQPVWEIIEGEKRQTRVHTTRQGEDGREEIIVYEKAGEQIRILDEKTLQQIDQFKRKRPRKVIVPLKRKNFAVATGASETELLGDVRHDPYGGHAQIGVLPYQRVIPGGIHEAHEGVLFIDEISSLSGIQRFLLTAMQEKKYPIIGRNPQSSGASVRVDDVPCDFVLVAASNINDLPSILPPLRSRIVGNGYEVLLNTVMPYTEENRLKYIQFIAQEIKKDGRIPHALMDAVEEILEEAKRRAAKIDNESNALTLRFREISGIIRLAGDTAVSNGAEFIETDFVKTAIERGRNIEEQLKEKYGSLWKAGWSDSAKSDRVDPKGIT
ncbi:ATP-binding protein [Candidatus Micrarchaeota archaeon]|nr:ATP-binding protein [Candidatus Micrarchaeota archaeon]